MEFRSFDIEGPWEIIPGKIVDARGYFSETFRLDRFSERIEAATFVQDNESLNLASGTVRGIHFQSQPAVQGKLVRCLSGRVFDVAVDLRRNSPNYGRWVSVILSPDENNHLWVPIGFGHAFCTLEPNSVISYRVTSFYSPENDLGVAWDDPDIAITWPDVADSSTLSGKDRDQPSLVALPAYFTVEDAR